VQQIDAFNEGFVLAGENAQDASGVTAVFSGADVNGVIFFDS
jgi:hypothetical protein